jgi:hypothetical protein
MSGRAQDLITKIYSYTADKLYEPVVVKRAFPLFATYMTLSRNRGDAPLHPPRVARYSTFRSAPRSTR